MHTCKICLSQIQQLRRHLTKYHKNITLEEYLNSDKDKEEFYEIEAKLKLKRSSSSPWSISFYTSRGFTEEKAKTEIQKLYKRKKKYYNKYQIEYYTSKGLTEEEAKTEIQIYKEKTSTVPTLEFYTKKHGVKHGTIKWNSYVENIKNREIKYLSKFDTELDGIIMRSICKGLGSLATVEYNYTDRNSYNRAVRLLTKLTILEHRELFNNYTKNNKYDIDHKYSLYGGFYHKISPFKLASIDNLRIIKKELNTSKGTFCSTSLEEVQSLKTILDSKLLSQEIKDKIKSVYIEKN